MCGRASIGLFSCSKSRFHRCARLHHWLESTAVLEGKSTTKSTTFVERTIATTIQTPKRKTGCATRWRRWIGNYFLFQILPQSYCRNLLCFRSQPLVNFGLQKKEREEKVSQLMKEKGPIWKLNANDDDIPINGTNGVNGANGTKSGYKPAPALKDVIGASLKYVGTYKKLDNKKQVVALIDDVIIDIFFNHLLWILI